MVTITAEQAILLVDGAAGIYCPQRTAERLLFPQDWGISDEMNKFLLAGPDADDSDEGLYWEFWDHVLNTARWDDLDGHTWTLFQNQDVWMVRDDVPQEWYEEMS